MRKQYIFDFFGKFLTRNYILNVMITTDNSTFKNNKSVERKKIAHVNKFSQGPPLVVSKSS